MTDGTVLILDDDADIRDSLSAMLEKAGITTRGHPSSHSLLNDPLPEGSACLLLDLRLPEDSGIQVQKRIQNRDPELPIIFLSGRADVPSAVQALKQGAFDFIEKGNLDPERLIEQVRTAIGYHGKCLQQRERSASVRERLARLTPREREVARLVAAGKANKVIAIELGISERTVEIHRGHAMKKLELRSAAELAKLVAEAGESIER